MDVHEQACFQDHVIVLIFKAACAQDGDDDDDDEVRASAPVGGGGGGGRWQRRLLQRWPSISRQSSRIHWADSHTSVTEAVKCGRSYRHSAWGCLLAKVTGNRPCLTTISASLITSNMMCSVLINAVNAVCEPAVRSGGHADVSQWMSGAGTQRGNALPSPNGRIGALV
jgi:hypothetical protein